MKWTKIRIFFLIASILFSGFCITIAVLPSSALQSEISKTQNLVESGILLIYSGIYLKRNMDIDLSMPLFRSSYFVFNSAVLIKSIFWIYNWGIYAYLTVGAFYHPFLIFEIVYGIDIFYFSFVGYVLVANKKTIPLQET